MKVSGKFLGSFNKTSILIQEPRAHARVVIGGGGWRALETVVLLELYVLVVDRTSISGDGGIL